MFSPIAVAAVVSSQCFVLELDLSPDVASAVLFVLLACPLAIFLFLVSPARRVCVVLVVLGHLVLYSQQPFLI